MSTNSDEEINALYDALEERERLVEELEAELTAQEKESEKQRDALINAQTVAKELRFDNERLLEVQTQLESRLGEQKRILAVASKYSEDAKRLQKESNHKLLVLEQENERLRATILEIEENEDILVNEIDSLVREKSEYQAKSEELSSKCDELYANVDEKDRTHSQLLKDKERAQDELSELAERHSKDTDDWERKEAASRTEIGRLLTELEEQRSRYKESAHVKENEAFRQELAKVRKDNARLQSLFDQCLLDKNQAERDLDSAIQALNASKRAEKEKVALAETSVELERTNAKLDSASLRLLDTHEQIKDLREQLERSEVRNERYERSNGLEEVVRHQKQLEADVRRRDHDLKKANHALGVEMDKNRVLRKACDLFKQKAPECTFDDEEVKDALAREDSENAELIRQIEAIEGQQSILNSVSLGT